MADYTELSDVELTELLRAGNDAVFSEIYNRYKWLLHAHAYKWMRNREEAKDIVHELFSDLWLKRKSLVYNGTLSGYLYTAVRNRIFNLLSHQQTESNYISSLQYFMEQSVCETDHRIREKQLIGIIEREIENLPAKMREVFELSRKANLTHREIAEKLNLSEQTVRKHIQHALKILRTRLGVYIFMLIFMGH